MIQRTWTAIFAVGWFSLVACIAWGTPPQEAGPQDDVFVIRLTDENIEDLKRGEWLYAPVPENLQGKLREVYVSYDPQREPRDAGQPPGQPPGQQPQPPGQQPQPSAQPPFQDDPNRSGQPVPGSPGHTTPQRDPQPTPTGSAFDLNWPQQFNDGRGSGSQPPERQGDLAPRPSGGGFAEPARSDTDQGDNRSRQSDGPLWGDDRRNDRSPWPVPAQDFPDTRPEAGRQDIDARQPPRDPYRDSGREPPRESYRDSGRERETNRDQAAGRIMPLPNLHSGESHLPIDTSMYSAPPRIDQRSPAAGSQHGNGPTPAPSAGIGAVAGVNTAALAPTNLDAINRSNSLLLMMLMLSIGLNLYLGWLARSFYIRYGELADELRDTFSAPL